MNRPGLASENGIWLVRHGATDWSASGRHTGRTDVPLTAEGRREAAALVRSLDPQRFALVLSSPLGRAVETARLAGYAGVVTLDPDLREWDYGEYEGLTIGQIRERDPAWTIWRGPVPNGETLTQVAARAERVLARVSGVDGNVLLFSHGHFLRVLTAAYLGLAPETGARFALETGTVNVLGHEHADHTLLRWNASA